jgi:cystathionine beta-synthase
MDVAHSVLDLIGNTPLVELHRVCEGIEATVLAKVEYLQSRRFGQGPHRGVDD